MKAAIFHSPGNITTEAADKPLIGPSDILVKVESCCICGSDLHMYKLGLFVDNLCRISNAGPIPGHEFSGVVAEVGSKVKGLSKGDRVAAFANGGMAEYVPIRPAFSGMNVFKIPAEISFNEAATLEPLANSIHAAKKGRPAEGENAVVFGAGIIGLGVIQALKILDFGLNRIVAVDVSDKRLEMAACVGADDLVNAGRDDVYARVQALLGVDENFGRPEIRFPKADIVYDCVGYIQDRPEPPVLQQAIMIARPRTGRIVVHGVFEAPLTLDFSIPVFKQLQIIGSFAMEPSDTIEAIELMRSKKVDREALISHEFSLDKTSEAFEMSCTVENSIKVLIRP